MLWLEMPLNSVADWFATDAAKFVEHLDQSLVADEPKSANGFPFNGFDPALRERIHVGT